MFAKRMTWVFITPLLLVLLWKPWPTGLPLLLLAVGLCADGILAARGSRAYALCVPAGNGRLRSR